MANDVVWLSDAASPLAAHLARTHRVLSAAPPAGEFVLIGRSTGADEALALAGGAGERCTGLVLIAPRFTTLPAAEAVPDVPMLVLLGTDDARVPPSAAAAICAALRRAHPVLIYGAGHALDSERVEAVAAVTRDFIARRDKFVVRDTSDVLYP